MASTSAKPVRSCKGCALNLGKRCGIFDHPVLKWRERKCEGFNNPAFIQHYERLLKPNGAHARAVERKTKAAQRRSVGYRDGTHRPSGRR